MNAKPHRAPALLVILSCIALAGMSFAADAPVSNAPAPVQRGMYDPDAIETIAGEVLKVDKVIPMKGRRTSIHLLVKTDKEEIPVHLGPVWYLDRQDVKFAPGDRIEVKGSRIRFRGMPAFVAGEVKKGDAVLKLRDEEGFPVWARGIAK